MILKVKYLKLKSIVWFLVVILCTVQSVQCTVQSTKVIFKVKYLKLKSTVWFLVSILCTVEKKYFSKRWALKGGH